jgi:hypothetical protein
MPVRRALLLTLLVTWLLPLVAEARWYTQPVNGRAVFAQEQAKSCALAATRMVVHTMTRRNIAEAHFRNRSAYYPGSYDPNVGTPLTNVAQLLREQGIDASFEYRDVDGLQRAIGTGNPALVSVRTTTGHHALVVDHIAGARGNREIYVRDPAGCCYGMGESEFCQDYTSESVVCYGASCEPRSRAQQVMPRAAPRPQIVYNPGPAVQTIRAYAVGPDGRQVPIDLQVSIRIGQAAKRLGQPGKRR